MIDHVKEHRLLKVVNKIESSYKYLNKTDRSFLISLQNVVSNLKDDLKKSNKYNKLCDITWNERRAFRVFSVKCIMSHTNKNKIEINDITKKIIWHEYLVSCYVSALRDAPEFMKKEIYKSLKNKMIEEYEKQTVN